MTSIVYNEIDAFAAQWTRNAMERDLVARGVVLEDDVRSLGDVARKHALHATQFHAFSGIGIWSLALRMAGWPDDAPVWTGSCPCQPFSQAGRKKGVSDERHLWPDWFRLIDARRPTAIFGEQVASPAGLAWFDAVSSDLEGAGYTVGAQDLCAAGVGAPHVRQRLYFVALADRERCQGLGVQLRDGRSRQALLEARRGREACGVADTRSDERDARRSDHASDGGESSEPSGLRQARKLGNASGKGSGRHARAVLETQGESTFVRIEARDLAHVSELAIAPDGFWREHDLVACRDQRWRPIEPGAFPLAHGSVARMGRLRAHGNQIVPQVASAFIESVIDYLIHLTESP